MERKKRTKVGEKQILCKSTLIVIVITFYSPSCLSQETAKGPFGLRVKLPPAHLSITSDGVEYSTSEYEYEYRKKLRVRVRVLILKNVLEYEYRKKVRVRVLLQV